MPFSLVPLPGYILVSRSESESISPGGIVLPDSAQQKAMKGTVVSVYDDYTDYTAHPNASDGYPVRLPVVSVGDTVMFKKYGGEEIEIAGAKFLFIKESDLLGVIKETT